MRRVAILTLIFCAPGLFAQQGPQTPRQALIEMFFSKQPGTLLKHLPAVTRAALEQSGAATALQQYSAMASQLQTQQGSLQTFESGPVMLSSTNARTGQKFELLIEKESEHGGEDDVELSIRAYKNGEVQKTPFLPHLVFAMKMESGVWTLHEIAVTIKLPLDDPDLIKSFTDGMKKARAAASTGGMQQVEMRPAGQESSGSMHGSGFGSQANVLAVMRTILSAEKTYAATYSSVGYTCTISDLDGFGADQPGPHQAMLIGSGLASGKSHGYMFSLSGCASSPATSFVLTATPMNGMYGQRVFCADQTGAIRASDAGSANSCAANGVPVP